MDGYISFINPNFLELWGFTTPDEILGKYFYDLWMAEEYRETIRRDLSGEKQYWMGDVQARKKDGSLFDVQVFIGKILDNEGNILGFTQTSVDISERKQVKEALEKRILALTRPLSDPQNIVFEELFNLDDIQKLQDEFANATGVASIITYPDGRPITSPSNFCYLCEKVIRKTEKGLRNCFRSDAALGQFHPEGPIVQPCLSGGLWDAGTSITVGGKHIASWLVGQVRDGTQNVEKIKEYARKIGADEEEAASAFFEVPGMSREKFNQVAQLVYTLGQQLSNIAYQNVQQARFITESKKNEEDLRQLRNYLSNIINSMPSTLVGVDKIGRITQWNSGAVREMGISPEDAVGQRIEDVFPRLASEMDRVREAMRTHQVLSELKKVRQDEGETCYEDITIYPLVSNAVEGAVIRIDDVTERVRIEEMMVQSEKMLSVGGLAAGMAHEINNPLAGMIQTANVLLNRLDSKQNIPANLRVADELGINMEDIHAFMEKRDIPRMLTAIQDSGKRVADIVQNMLSFARKSEAMISNYFMDDVLDKTIELAETDYNLKKHYDFRKISIIREYEENLPGIPCEAAKIQQVLLNILRNGAEAMQEADSKEPHFIIRTMCEKEQKFVRIEIEDNGPGMDEKIRKRVFEPFFTTKPPGVGTGLGLSVSYFIIVENHHGEMFVESHPGEGTKFVIRLPQERTLLHEGI
jgi:PAS domain S-box-containing protein